MNPHLNYMIARHLRAELQHAGQQARLAEESHARRSKSPDTDPIIRASERPARTSARRVTPLEIERTIGGKR
jgi:hypothetical protein